jgi:1-acyl-sn-glycerol-3-phosphate acyltransferase
MSRARARSLFTTVVLWGYFIGCFLAGYWLAFLVAGLLLGRRGLAWGLGSYSRGFFALLGLLVPRARLRAPDRRELRKRRGTVVVCNHISFLDPLLLLSLLPRPITIVRPDFFRVPIFGWLLRGAGFLGPDLFAEGQPWVERIARHLRAGGNLLIFPEGTRSRDGNHLFAPGRLVFDATATEPIEVQKLAALSKAEADAETSHELTQRVRALYENHC